METKFKIGDSVRLKSGSPRMTVMGYESSMEIQEAVFVNCCYSVNDESSQFSQ
ncbi:MAG: DUF2158 domain-containing protein [Tannerellaceae bacterium]|nr:DUF2158 domain-containing protein [Tannerellaceae bacterium]